MTFRVKLSAAAKSDAEDAYEWMKANQQYAQVTRWFNGLVDAVFSLEEMPHRCPAAPESELLGVEVRQLLYGKGSGTYRVLFSLVKAPTGQETVQVYRIWHGARDAIRSEDMIREEEAET